MPAHFCHLLFQLEVPCSEKRNFKFSSASNTEMTSLTYIQKSMFKIGSSGRTFKGETDLFIYAY